MVIITGDRCFVLQKKKKNDILSLALNCAIVYPVSAIVSVSFACLCNKKTHTHSTHTQAAMTNDIINHSHSET